MLFLKLLFCPSWTTQAGAVFKQYEIKSSHFYEIYTEQL